MSILTGDLDAERVRQIVSQFPRVSGFGIGTKLSGEVRAVAGVIFKACLIDGQPTLKTSGTIEKSTLPGRLQVFRGSDGDGNYVADVVGLDDEHIEISGATRVERLIVPCWEKGWHEPLLTITTLKTFVEEQRRRFTDIHHYPHTLSDRLRALRDRLATQMHADYSEWETVLNLPAHLRREMK
ncbi:MAG: hypothetical protein WKF30_16370 [Pyrinomonadaceae bacterium]